METDFYNQIYDLVRLVPSGRVTSYGAIAKALGAAKSSRMVGFAMSASHGLLPYVPAHRVVNHKGLLTGKFHFHPPERMEQLLAQEGVAVVNDQVTDFKNLFWDPQQEL
ncbi:MAG: MGMT family protein [Sphingobacteriaceae bacterium]|nr:MGMT family protein [Sphingobacteriaceae bacterium]